jgi:hypothetical protein
MAMLRAGETDVNTEDRAKVDAALADVLDRAQGNAFFAEQLLAELTARRAPSVGVPRDLADLLLLRLERLAPAVLFCLFDGIPRTVHLEEPRQGVQFGFDMTNQPNGTTKAQLRPRNATTFDYIGGSRLDVKFRHRGASGVVDIKRLEEELAEIDETLGPDDQMNSGEYALQLVRFPWRQVWGDMANADTPAANKELAFKPVISYKAMVTRVFVEEP